MPQLIPSDIQWDPNATPPQYTNNEDTVIEPGTHVRVKILGTRSEVGEMWAIGSIKEDYLGYSLADLLGNLVLTLTLLPVAFRTSPLEQAGLVPSRPELRRTCAKVFEPP